MKLLDTSVVLDIDRGGVGERVTRLDDEGRHATSMVTVTELRLGVNKRYEAGTAGYDDAVDDLDRLLARFDVLAVTRPVAVDAAEIVHTLRSGGNALHDLHDIYIAATARTEQLPVLTANTDHFERIDDVRVVDWSDF